MTLVITGLPVVMRTLRGIWRGQFASDITASLAIIGAAALGEPLPGLVIVLMQTGGEALDAYAGHRASRAVRALEERMPRLVHRLRAGLIEEIPALAVQPGDRLLIRPGDVVACDGLIASGTPLLDLSSLTGEPIPVTLEPGAAVRSGSQNLTVPFELDVTAPAAASEYARIVELVRHAQAGKAPLQRIADRYAVWFTPFTLVVCLAAWAVSGDPARALAVLVVATPCPLILAAPVAIIGGINRAATRGIIFRHGGALEATASIGVVIADKTGTLTEGRPAVADVLPVPGTDANAMLTLAAAVEQGSGHLLASSVVAEAAARGLTLAASSEVVETPGRGIRGLVGGHEVAIGNPGWVRAAWPAAAAPLDALQASRGPALLAAHVVVDGAAAGVIIFADRLRDGVSTLFEQLRARGVRRSILLSGDTPVNVQDIAARIGVAEAHGDLTPAEKAAFVTGLRDAGERVLMIGDGLNDAPALSAATVGVALASGSGGITAEAADIVILANDPRQLVAAVDISRRTLRIARQSIGVGLGLSAFGMLLAAAGWLTPVAGAVAQEVVDLAVILNALRAARDARTVLAPTP